MIRRSMLSRIRSAFNRRDETGAGALLPIIVVGLIVVSVAASTAAAVSFSSKISTAQIKSASDDAKVKSLLALFESGIYHSSANAVPSSTAPSPTSTRTGYGKYKVYYSAAATAPTSVSTSGVTALTTSGIPSTAKWLLVVVTPEGGSDRIAVYSFFKAASPTFDSALNWTGQINIGSNSVIRGAKGNTGPVSVVGREGTASASTGFSIGSVTDTAADVYTSYSTKSTSLTMGTVRGDIVARGTLSYIYEPTVYGNSYTTSSTTPGVVKGGGTVKASATTASLPATPGQTALKPALPTTVATLVAADCSTAAKLKAKLESYTTNGTIKGVNTCAAASWATTIKPKANLVLDGNSTTAALAISGLTITGTKNLSIHAAYGLNLTNVQYKDGSSGQILSGGVTNIVTSKIVGAVGNYGTAGAKFYLDRSTLEYLPVASNLCSNDTSTTTCTAISSTNLHMVRVR